MLGYESVVTVLTRQPQKFLLMFYDFYSYLLQLYTVYFIYFCFMNIYWRLGSIFCQILLDFKCSFKCLFTFYVSDNWSEAILEFWKNCLTVD